MVVGFRLYILWRRGGTTNLILQKEGELMVVGFAVKGCIIGKCLLVESLVVLEES